MSHFKILIQHYLRCPFRTAVTARRATTQLSDCAPLLQVMYERAKATYFSLPRHCPPEAAVGEECELSRRNNWPWSGASQRARRRRGAAAKEEARRWKDGRRVRQAAAILQQPCAHLIGIQSTVGSMREYRWTAREGGVCCLSQPSLPAGKSTGEPASETDTLSPVK